MTSGYIEDADRLFARFVVTQALLLPVVPESLRVVAFSVASELQLQLPEPADVGDNGSSQPPNSLTRLAKPTSLGESCPACRSEVLLEDLATATCANGHIWRQSFVSQAPVVRAIDRDFIQSDVPSHPY